MNFMGAGLIFMLCEGSGRDGYVILRWGVMRVVDQGGIELHCEDNSWQFFKARCWGNLALSIVMVVIMAAIFR